MHPGTTVVRWQRVANLLKPATPLPSSNIPQTSLSPKFYYSLLIMAWTEPHPTRLPSPQEIAEGRSIIRDADIKIAALSNQIGVLSKLRSHYQTIRDNQKSFIAAFRRLPPEILEQIALCYLNEQEFLGVGVLYQVCSSLRAVVLRMKWIWKKIRIVQERIARDYLVSPFIESPLYLKHH
jgi:hypothetical protein